KFKKDRKRDPTTSAITAYDAVYVIADSIERTVKEGKPLNRSNLRDAIQAAKLSSLQGPIAFDPNGDILTRTVSIYQWRDGEIKYVAVGPQKERAPADPRPPHGAGRPVSPPAMASLDVLLQQIVNGLALGMMYALLALGFTMVYGIIELINFAHFSVFMTGTFVGLVVLNLMGVTADSRSLTG